MTPERAAQIQAVLGASHTHVAEPALLGHLGRGADRRGILLALVERPLMRQQAFFHPHHEHDRKLEALDHVQRDQRRALAVFVVGVDV